MTAARATPDRSPAWMAQASARIASRSEPEPNLGCLLFLGCVTADGYGQIRFGTERFMAHRLAYEAAVGPIGEGLTLDHRCKQRSCVEVRHLEVVTQGENTLRGDGSSGVNARKTECREGHPYSGENLIVSNRGWRDCRICLRARQRRYALSAYRGLVKDLAPVAAGGWQ